MRCNRKTACFAVTPRGKSINGLNITKIGQLRRRENRENKWAIPPSVFSINLSKSMTYNAISLLPEGGEKVSAVGFTKRIFLIFAPPFGS